MAQLVARYLGVVEAVGSSPVTQTIEKTRRSGKEMACFLFVKMIVTVGKPKTKIVKKVLFYVLLYVLHIKFSYFLYFFPKSY